MSPEPNGERRPIQFWISIISIGGLVLTTLFLLLATTSLALYGSDSNNESDTLNNGLLLSLGGLVSLAGAIGGWLYGRGAQGEPIPGPAPTTMMLPGETRTATQTMGPDDSGPIGGAT